MTTSGPVDLDDIIVKGGAGRVALLRYSVMSVTMEPIFLFLVREFQFRPTHAALLALYDLFCASDAPARVNAPAALPPRDLKLASVAREIQTQSDFMSAERPEGDDATKRITAPHRMLFDDVVAALKSDPEGALARVSLSYDPSLDPIENLPGGAMTASQRRFVDNVWRPLARPRIVRAGFWQMSTIE